MARRSSDREDLMAELVTFSPRVSLLVPEFSAEIVAGRRTDGRWAVFFGGDPVYHFDADGRLRRAFVGDNLYRSQGQTLARLTRQVSDTETILLRHDLDEAELTEFQSRACDLFDCLLQAISAQKITIKEVAPPEADFLPELALLIQNVIVNQCPLAASLKK
jgi:hypothetical protein